VTGYKTFWHLGDAQRKPTDYEVATSRLLYYTERGFELSVPLAGWYERYQRASPLKCRDWERFRDPRETTYTRYTELQASKQAYVEGLFRSASVAYERSLPATWIAILERVLGPMRFPVHGLQMAAAYVGQMAPGGRLVVVTLMQAADEMRRIQGIAYRMRQLQRAHTSFGEASRAVWEEDPAWQPWRELIERLLVTYDWGEAFVALNLVVKPCFDDVFVRRLGRLARSRGDDVLAGLLFSFDEDCDWHREWTRAAVATAVDDDGGNRDVIDGWVERWQPLATRAVDAVGSLVEGGR
jgi:toluene monooxygenase system protein E